jgi:hypothetical protein
MGRFGSMDGLIGFFLDLVISSSFSYSIFLGKTKERRKDQTNF